MHHAPTSNGTAAVGGAPVAAAAERVVHVGTGPLSFADVVSVARRDVPVELSPDALGAIAASRGAVEALAVDERPHYGVSTGFGALATRHIAPERRAALQRSLIRSHAAGTGPEVEREVVRAMMLLRLSTLATGHTGIHPDTAGAYAGLLNAGITPVVHEHGSLGCSGDLAPLGRDVAGGEGAEAGADAVVRALVDGERLDGAAARGDRAERLVGQVDRRAVARDGDHVAEADRTRADLDRRGAGEGRCHGPIEHAAGAAVMQLVGLVSRI